MVKNPLLLFPSGGNAWEALSCLGDEYEAIGFIDDDVSQQGTFKLGLPIFGREALKQFPNAKVLAVMGSPTNYLLRQSVIESLEISEERWATVVHASAQISSFAKIGKNCLIMANVVMTANCTVGDHVIILPQSVVHHDVIIGDFACIGSRVVIAGHSQIGKNCYIGGGSSIINNISIGEKSLVGFGSNVIQSVAPFTKVAGNPAKVLRSSLS